MRCPNCGLVHPDSELYCRRCLIDMHTGEPMHEVRTAESAPPAQRLQQAAETLLLSAMSASRRSASQLKNTMERAGSSIRKIDFKALAAGLKDLAARGETLKTIPCLQCEGQMNIQRIHDYGAGGTIALFLMGAVLMGLGFLAWPLFVTGALSVGLGVFFHRKGKTRWRCPSCGFNILRHP